MAKTSIQQLRKCVKAVEKADLLIVVGTSFKVYPFAGLIAYRQPDAKLVAVNKENLGLDPSVLSITDDAAKVFEQL